MNSLGWQTVVATPPMVHQGFITVWPPVTVELASKAQSLNKNIFLRSCNVLLYLGAFSSVFYTYNILLFYQIEP